MIFYIIFFKITFFITYFKFYLLIFYLYKLDFFYFNYILKFRLFYKYCNFCINVLNQSKIIIYITKKNVNIINILNLKNYYNIIKIHNLLNITYTIFLLYNYYAYKKVYFLSCTLKYLLLKITNHKPNNKKVYLIIKIKFRYKTWLINKKQIILLELC